jgi:hypothetical protein
MALYGHAGIPGIAACSTREHYVPRSVLNSRQKFLQNVDVFLFYPSWKRQEPWSRSIGRPWRAAVQSLRRSGGNEDQIIRQQRFPLRSLDDFDRFLSEMIEARAFIASGGMPTLRGFFNSPFIVQKLMEFIQ